MGLIAIYVQAEGEFKAGRLMQAFPKLLRGLSRDLELPWASGRAKSMASKAFDDERSLETRVRIPRTSRNHLKIILKLLLAPGLQLHHAAPAPGWRNPSRCLALAGCSRPHRALPLRISSNFIDFRRLFRSVHPPP